MAQGQIARFRRLLAGQCHNRANLLGREARWGARTRRIGQALSDRRGLGRGAPATLPMAYRLRPNAELACGLANPGTRRCQQDQLRPFRQLSRRRVCAHQAGQHLLMRRGHHDGFGRQTWHRGLGESKDEWVIRHATPLAA